MVRKDDPCIGIDPAAQLFQPLCQKEHHGVVVVLATEPTAIKNIAQRINGDDIGRPIGKPLTDGIRHQFNPKFT